MSDRGGGQAMAAQKQKHKRWQSNRIRRELGKIARRHGGMLRAGDVVEAARSKDSILHGYFTWDDTKAAKKWRLVQARNLIRVQVVMLDRMPARPVSAFVSLSTDRGNQTGGGYRPIIKIMTDDEKREQLLSDALMDLKRFRERYSMLKELAAVIEAMDVAERKLVKELDVSTVAP